MLAMEGEPVALRIISQAQQPLDNSYQRRDHCARMCQAIESFRTLEGHWRCEVLTVCHSGTSTHAPKHQDSMNMTAMVKRPRPTASAMRARPFVRGARSCTKHRSWSR